VVVFWRAPICVSALELGRCRPETRSGAAFRVRGLRGRRALHDPACGGEISHAILASHSLELAGTRRRGTCGPWSPHAQP